MSLIKLAFVDERYGRDRSYNDVDKALGDIDEEVSNWSSYFKGYRNALSDESHQAFKAPLNAWLNTQAECKRLRRSGPLTEEHQVSYRGIAEFHSPVGYTLRWMIEKVNPISAHYAALFHEMDEGDIPFDNPEATSGILLFDRMLNKMNAGFQDNVMLPQQRRLQSISLDIDGLSEN